MTFVVQLQSCLAWWSMTLQEHQGFHLFSETVLLCFDFLTTGATEPRMATKPKYSVKITAHFAMAFVFAAVGLE